MMNGQKPYYCSELFNYEQIKNFQSFGAVQGGR